MSNANHRNPAISRNRVNVGSATANMSVLSVCVIPYGRNCFVGVSHQTLIVVSGFVFQLFCFMCRRETGPEPEPRLGLIDWTLFLNGEDISTKPPIHISAVATILLITKTFTVKYYYRRTNTASVKKTKQKQTAIVTNREMKKIAVKTSGAKLKV